MVSQSTRANHWMRFSAIAFMAATLMLAACGGGMATIAPPPTTAAAVLPTATLAVGNSQTGVTPTNALADTVSATVRQLLPTASPTAAATVAASVTKPAAAPNANAGSAAGSADPCALITKADYLVVMGDAANDPVKKNRPTIAATGLAASSCEYKIASANKVEFVTVNVMQRDASAATQLDIKTYWEGTKKAWATMQSKVTPLPEIGPEVFLVVNPTLEQIGAGGAVHFLKDNVIFDVQVATGSGTVIEQNAAGNVAAKKLGAMAFGRL